MVVEGGSPPSSLFSFFLSHFWPLFFTPRSCPHTPTPPGLPQAGERFDAEGSRRSRGANPPLPLPVNTEKKHKTRTGPFSDLQFQPRRRSSFCATASNTLPAHAYIYYKSRHRSAIITCAQNPVRHLCLATLVRTPRSAHGTGAVRYGTARVESSPVSTRAAFQYSIYRH